MQELLNIFFTVDSKGKETDKTEPVLDRFVQFRNPTKLTSEEIGTLIQSIISNDQLGVKVSPVDISQEKRLYEFLANITEPHSIEIDDHTDPKYCRPRDIHVIFEREADLEEKLKIIIINAMLASNQLLFDHSSWIPF